MICQGALTAWLLLGMLSGAFIAHLAPMLTKQQLGIHWPGASPIERLAVVSMAVLLGPSVLILEWRMVGLVLRAETQIMRGRCLRRISALASEAMVAGMSEEERADFNARFWSHMRHKRGYDAMSLRQREDLERAFISITGTDDLPTDQDVARATAQPAVPPRFNLARALIEGIFAVPALAFSVLKR